MSLIEVQMHCFHEFLWRRRLVDRVDGSFAVEPVRFDGIQPRTSTRKKEQEHAGIPGLCGAAVVGCRPAFEAFVP